MNETKSTIWPRDPKTCEQEFFKWLEGRAGLSGSTHERYVEAMRECLGEYVRAKAGITGVNCFCGQPALAKREMKISRGIGTTEPYVCMCRKHLAEFDAANSVRLALEKEIYSVVELGKL